MAFELGLATNWDDHPSLTVCPHRLHQKHLCLLEDREPGIRTGCDPLIGQVQWNGKDMWLVFGQDLQLERDRKKKGRSLWTYACTDVVHTCVDTRNLERQVFTHLEGELLRQKMIDLFRHDKQAKRWWKNQTRVNPEGELRFFSWFIRVPEETSLAEWIDRETVAIYAALDVDLASWGPWQWFIEALEGEVVVPAAICRSISVKESVLREVIDESLNEDVESVLPLAYEVFFKNLKQVGSRLLPGEVPTIDKPTGEFSDASACLVPHPMLTSHVIDRGYLEERVGPDWNEECAYYGFTNSLDTSDLRLSKRRMEEEAHGRATIAESDIKSLAVVTRHGAYQLSDLDDAGLSVLARTVMNERDHRFPSPTVKAYTKLARRLFKELDANEPVTPERLTELFAAHSFPPRKGRPPAPEKLDPLETIKHAKREKAAELTRLFREAGGQLSCNGELVRVTAESTKRNGECLVVTRIDGSESKTYWKALPPLVFLKYT